MRRRSHFWHYATAPHLKKSACALERVAAENPDPRRICLVTVAIGPEARQVASITAPALEAYAERCGYDTMTYRTTGDHVSPAWTRFDALQLLGRYDLIIYIDNDIIIKDEAPPIGWVLRGDDWDFAAFDSGELGYMRDGAVRDVRRYCADAGLAMPDYDGAAYPNSGVMAFRNTEAMRAWKPAESTTGWQDQNAVAYAAITGALRWQTLGREWNFGHMHKPENRVAALHPTRHFIHFNGISYKNGRFAAMQRWQNEYRGATA
jgi:hypothetical protein